MLAIMMGYQEPVRENVWSVGYRTKLIYGRISEVLTQKYLESTVTIRRRQNQAMGQRYAKGFNYRFSISIYIILTFHEPSTETTEPIFLAEPDFCLKRTTMGE